MREQVPRKDCRGAGLGRDFLGELCLLADVSQSRQEVRQAELALGLSSLLVGTRLAQMELSHLVVDNFGQMDRRFFLSANIAHHKVVLK